MELQRSTFGFSVSCSISPLYSSNFHRRRIRRCPSLVSIRSTLPFSPQKAKYYRELQVAVDVVQRACRICVDVQKSLFSDDGRILEKNDNTPVTIADFSVQALISLELRKMLPLIPLVAEEDSAFFRSNNLADAVVNVVNGSTSITDKLLSNDDVLEAIDRGGSVGFAFDAKPATYWVLGERTMFWANLSSMTSVLPSFILSVLDPIDGTRGFLKGGGALYVVGLSLIVEGEIVLGVMGCPNWPVNSSIDPGCLKDESEAGIIMVAHVGCGTWTKRLSGLRDGLVNMGSFWERCFVSECSSVHEAHFCIPDSQTWDSLPLSDSFSATPTLTNVGDKQIRLLPTCCGSLCKYLMVASGRASVFILRAKVQTSIKAWDHVVGMICVHEAGGKVTDWKGSQLDLAVDEAARRAIFPSGGVLVTNGTLHGQILELISSSSSIVS